ncbi:ORF6N domain-containing protein [Olsenella sp. oral taxon 807]|uniref:ORF6N domain-containing protein n=1 Tax=Olsenella sp. oral taxon 807 TaxID=712411 RepID=UPI00067CE917|nr:ORF6N domain-containing protein [Olsenella sp. oral taxon 807]
MIHTVHDQQVMLDSDLAELCGVLTGNLNKAASRNAERFSEDFRFRVSKEEHESLMLQTGISNDGGRGGRRKPPYVHTEQGASMLSAVLRSEVAVRASVQIIRAFVEMRHLIAVPS